jgi:hypothetical protein
MISLDAGGLLLCELAIPTDLIRPFSCCFVDYHDQRFVVCYAVR